MRIAIVNKAGALSGGAGRMATSLSEWLTEAGHSTSMLFAEQTGYGTSVRGRPTRLLKSIEVRTLMNEVVPFDYPGLKRAVDAFGPDVVHVHDISRAFSIDAIGRLARAYPVVWTMHDQSAITGGCISPHPCTRFESGCGHCPKFGSWSLQGRIDLTAYALKRKAKFYADTKVVYAAPSKWAADRLATSYAFSGHGTVHIVPNAIRPAEISHITRTAARRRLGVPQDRFVIVLISHDLDDHAKNPPSQREALRQLADLDPLIVLMGNATPAYERSLAPLDVRGLGFVDDPRIKRLTYASADVFVNASMSDTFSLTTLESLATGTPVVAYASGGIPEILTPECGVLVAPDDGDAMSAAVRRLATHGVPPQWPDAARARAREFSPERHVDGYLDLYARAAQGFRP